MRLGYVPSNAPAFPVRLASLNFPWDSALRIWIVTFSDSSLGFDSSFFEFAFVTALFRGLPLQSISVQGM